jgi:hypothetical protein
LEEHRLVKRSVARYGITTIAVIVVIVSVFLRLSETSVMPLYSS